MTSATRIYNRNGAYLSEADSIDFGSISAASYRDPQIVSLKVESVDSISNVKLKIEFSQNTDVDEGFVEYYTSKDIIQDFANIKKRKFDLNQDILVDVFGIGKSEYVYLWIDPQKITFRGDVSLRFKWTFDYVEASSSSSSSSSCQYGEFTTILPFESVHVSLDDCENAYFKFDLGYSDYCTLFIDGDIFVVENDGGCLIVNDVDMCGDGVCEEYIISGNTYSFCLMDYGNFLAWIYRAGDCSPYPHLLLTTRDDLLLLEGIRLLLLEGTTLPKDQLLMTDGDGFLYVDETGFYLLS